jgi:hypothetical protein
MTAGRYGKWNESQKLESKVQKIGDRRMEAGGLDQRTEAGRFGRLLVQS